MLTPPTPQAHICPQGVSSGGTRGNRTVILGLRKDERDGRRDHCLPREAGGSSGVPGGGGCTGLGEARTHPGVVPVRFGLPRQSWRLVQPWGRRG